MYYYNNYHNYSNEHLYNARKVIIKNYKCELNIETHELEFRTIGWSKMFYFNNKGVLQEVIKYSKQHIIKEVYTYNKKNKPISIFSFDYISNQLRDIILLTYDDKDRISNEEVITTSFYQNDLVVENIYEHEYGNNTHKVTFEQETSREHSHIADYDEWVFEEKLNGCDQVIEFKSSAKLEGFHLWTKYHYSNYGELIHEIDLDENHGVCSETLYDKDNRIYKYVNEDNPESTVFESKFEYNEKGHWIKECVLRNGELLSIIEKSIEYYK